MELGDSNKYTTPNTANDIQFIVFCCHTVDIDNISLDSVFGQFLDCYITEQMQELFDNAAEAAKAAKAAKIVDE